MSTKDWLAEQFEANRDHLQAVAFRMLGSLSEANDAVQEAWLHLSRSDASDIRNMGGWLTTVVARICLDMLRSPHAKRDVSLEETSEYSALDIAIRRDTVGDPEQEAVMADSVGIALLVVLNTLPPAERLAFVLHDIFGMPFDEIAPIVERTETAARQLASRARRRVQGSAVSADANLAHQREIAEAFLTASREGSFEALLNLLDPEIVFRADPAAAAAGGPAELHGAESVVKQFMGRAQGARIALINDSVGAVVTRQNRLFLVLLFKIDGDKIIEIEAVADHLRLSQLRISVLSN